MNEFFSLMMLIPLALSIAAGSWWFTHHQRKNKHQRQQLGIELLMQLRTLLMLTQKHRGASYGALRGDDQLKHSLSTIEQPLLKVIESIQHHPYLHQQEHWLAYQDHWQRLHLNNLQLDAENNLAQHNQLISVLLYLLEDIAEQTRLNELASDELSKLWRELPRTAELVGQARVLGSGILAEGKADTVHKIRMRFVRGKLQEYANQHPAQSDQLARLLTVIDQQILSEQPCANDETHMSASDYFELSTRAIEPFFRQMDEGLNQLKMEKQ